MSEYLSGWYIVGRQDSGLLNEVRRQMNDATTTEPTNNAVRQKKPLNGGAAGLYVVPMDVWLCVRSLFSHVRIEVAQGCRRKVADFAVGAGHKSRQIGNDRGVSENLWAVVAVDRQKLNGLGCHAHNVFIAVLEVSNKPGDTA